MDSRSRFGLVLVLIGIYWLMGRFFPILSRLTNSLFPWPFLMIVVGILLLFKKSNRN